MATKEFTFGDNVPSHILRAIGVDKCKRTVKVTEASRMNLDSTWGGGSRDVYEGVSFGSADRPGYEGGFTPVSLPVQTSPFSFGGTMGAHAPEYELVAGVAVVQHVTFQGKDLGYRIHLHPADYARIVTEAETCQIHDECRAHPEMGRACVERGQHRPDERSLRILASFRSLKSGPYRKEALDRLGFTTEDADRLVAAGWLSRNKAGAMAVTQVGRALASDVSI
jgi:hypothetical protein